MDPNISAVIYCQQAQTFISHLTFVCTIVIASATLVSLVFTVVTAIIGSSIYKLNKDLRDEHDELRQNIQKDLSMLNRLSSEYKIQLKMADSLAYRLTTDPKLLKSRELLDSFVETMQNGKYRAGTQTGELVSAMYNLSELGEIEDMKRFVMIRDLAQKQELGDIETDATRALLRMAEKTAMQ